MSSMDDIEEIEVLEVLEETNIQKTLTEIKSLLGTGASTLELAPFLTSHKSLFITKIFNNIKQDILIIAPSIKKSEDLYNDLSLLAGADNVLYFPSFETLAFELASHMPLITSKRLETLYTLSTKDTPKIIVAPIEAVVQKVMPKIDLMEKSFTLTIGDEINRDDLSLKLLASGYRQVSMVEERGELSIRGDIIDIFTPNTITTRPVRIEVFGDEIESIKTFDPLTQRSEKEIIEIQVLPAKELDFSEKAREKARKTLIDRAEDLNIDREKWDKLQKNIFNSENMHEMDAFLPFFYDKLATIYDYLKKDTLIIDTNTDDIDDYLTHLEETLPNYKENIYSLVKEEESYLLKDEYKEKIKSFSTINTKEKAQKLSIKPVIGLRESIKEKKDLSPLVEKINEMNDRGVSVFITSHNRGSLERFKELMQGYGKQVLEKTTKDLIENKGSKDSINLIRGSIKEGGFLDLENKNTLITEEEIFGERIEHKVVTEKPKDAFTQRLKDLKDGDLIVHKTHGIGMYKGLKRVEANNIENDFLLLEYAAGDKLYLPVQKMDIISSYVLPGGSERKTILDKLGAGNFEKKKAKAKKAIQEIATDLIKLYSKREEEVGISFNIKDRLYKEFEASFEFTETPDQARAILEVIKDMERIKPMERLVCGDVGYGKTEVAMRASCVSALNGKQVAILVPTTILTQQHFLTFKQRFESFPITVDYISRFKTKKEQAETLLKLKEGKIDIIIGTHRLLQKDIEFKELGLLIVDEEHRFGVRHKEKIKSFKTNIDVLTLTATPIPRTLQMAFSDIRDLSIINTAPKDRLAIKTRVINFDTSLIKEAILREKERGGQIFFVHNRVKTIFEMEQRIKTIVPDLKITTAHGQMNEHVLEKKMMEFIDGESDLLLSTTIIESGLDIARANTIIIDRADSFGLSELYQLRGRVGRSSHRAYAYLIAPPEKVLSREGRLKLDAIKELTELGSGFHIATYDLEIRGAGEILGGKQSGFIMDIGFDAYVKLLEDTIKELRGTKEKEEIEVDIDLQISNFIAEDYVEDTMLRLRLYKRFALLKTKEEALDLRDEIYDRFGPVSVEVDNMVNLSIIKNELKTMGINELTRKMNKLYISFDKTFMTEYQSFASMLIEKTATINNMSITPTSKLVFKIESDKINIFKSAEAFISIIKEIYKESKIVN